MRWKCFIVISLQLRVVAKVDTPDAVAASSPAIPGSSPASCKPASAPSSWWRGKEPKLRAQKQDIPAPSPSFSVSALRCNSTYIFTWSCPMVYLTTMADFNISLPCMTRTSNMFCQKPSATSSGPAVNQFWEEMTQSPPSSVSWMAKPWCLSPPHQGPINHLNTSYRHTGPSLRVSKGLRSTQPREWPRATLAGFSDSVPTATEAPLPAPDCPGCRAEPLPMNSNVP